MILLGVPVGGVFWHHSSFAVSLLRGKEYLMLSSPSYLVAPMCKLSDNYD